MASSGCCIVSHDWRVANANIMVSEVTQLLQEWNNGNQNALERLMPIVYRELRAMAAKQFQAERLEHTLQATALVHELYLRLVDWKETKWNSRVQFFSVAGRIMRNILVDAARTRMAGKRGAGVVHVTLDEAVDWSGTPNVDVLALERALEKLEALDPQQVRVIELRFFTGLSIEDTAQALNISPATVKRDWGVARVWLHRELRLDATRF